MQRISIVIITKNEALNIVECIRSAQKVSNDIIVLDSASTDDTVKFAQACGVRVEFIVWKGYGHARNMGARLVANDWILSLDADERITDGLAEVIHFAPATDPKIIYGFRRKNFFGSIPVRYGELANDRVFRLYNRNCSSWNDAPVHEKLIGENVKHVMLTPSLMHYGIRSKQHYCEKKMGYASLCALKYLREERRFVTALLFISPVFHFIKSYIFQLGFLDIRTGFLIAKINAQYTRKKYEDLRQLQNEHQQPEYRFLRNSVRKIISLLS